MSDAKPKTTGSIFANALAGRHDYGGGKEAAAGMSNTLSCTHCGAARERDAEGPLVCRYCGTPLTHASLSNQGPREGR